MFSIKIFPCLPLRSVEDRHMVVARRRAVSAGVQQVPAPQLHVEGPEVTKGARAVPASAASTGITARYPQVSPPMIDLTLAICWDHQSWELLDNCDALTGMAIYSYNQPLLSNSHYSYTML